MKVSSGQEQSAFCNEGDGAAREDCGRAPSVSHQNVARFPLPVPVGSLRHLKRACDHDAAVRWHAGEVRREILVEDDRVPGGRSMEQP